MEPAHKMLIALAARSPIGTGGQLSARADNWAASGANERLVGQSRGDGWREDAPAWRWQDGRLFLAALPSSAGGGPELEAATESGRQSWTNANSAGQSIDALSPHRSGAFVSGRPS